MERFECNAHEYMMHIPMYTPEEYDENLSTRQDTHTGVSQSYIYIYTTCRFRSLVSVTHLCPFLNVTLLDDHCRLRPISVLAVDEDRSVLISIRNGSRKTDVHTEADIQ